MKAILYSCDICSSPFKVYKLGFLFYSLMCKKHFWTVKIGAVEISAADKPIPTENDI